MCTFDFVSALLEQRVRRCGGFGTSLVRTRVIPLPRCSVQILFTNPLPATHKPIRRFQWPIAARKVPSPARPSKSHGLKSSRLTLKNVSS
jgi:hypothetical protein